MKGQQQPIKNPSAGESRRGKLIKRLYHLKKSHKIELQYLIVTQSVRGNDKKRPGSKLGEASKIPFLTCKQTLG